MPVIDVNDILDHMEADGLDASDFGLDPVEDFFASDDDGVDYTRSHGPGRVVTNPNLLYEIGHMSFSGGDADDYN